MSTILVQDEETHPICLEQFIVQILEYKFPWTRLPTMTSTTNSTKMI